MAKLRKNVFFNISPKLMAKLEKILEFLSDRQKYN